MIITPLNILLLFFITGIVSITGFLIITTIPYQDANAQSQCHPTLWKYVWVPDRLTKIGDKYTGACITVTGYIHQIKKERDGDAHLLIKVDPKYDKIKVNYKEIKLLTEGNYVSKAFKRTSGYLVAEIVCHYKSQKPEAAHIACKSKPNTYDPNIHKLTIPPLNSHVSITGYLVHDQHHPGKVKEWAKNADWPIGHKIADWTEIHPVSNIKKIK